MRISIVIPAYNEAKLIGATLSAVRDACAALTVRGWEHEIIVCDNNSTDETARQACAGGATVVFEPVNQISRARNRGASVASGDWLVFVDADSSPSTALFEEMSKVIDGGLVVGGGSVVTMDADQSWAGWLISFWNGISRVCCWMAGSFIFCEARVFRQLGGFSQDLFISEEIDFSRRLKREARHLGRKVVILTRHPLSTSNRKLHLYQKRDYIRLLWGALWSRGASFRDRSACIPWYDGRR